jgi:GT2 family glycosyltransferase
MNISIIIPNYNGEKLLAENIPKVIDAVSEYKNGTIEIIIPDDGSKDTSIEIVQNLSKRYTGKITIKLVQNRKNRGFSSNVNTGVAVATGEILVLLNTDVIPHKGFLEPLLVHFTDKKVFGVGCVDESVENGSIILRGRGVGAWKRGFLIHRAGSVEKTNTLWVSGGSSAFRKSLWDKLGGLNEFYNPFYWEDIDLSYRAQKAGYKVILEPKSRVVHEHEKGSILTSQRSFKVRKIAYRNQFFFVWLNITDPMFLLSHIFWIPFYFLRTLLRGDGAFIFGFFAALSKFPPIIFQRNRIQKFFVVSDKEVIAKSLK